MGNPTTDADDYKQWLEKLVHSIEISNGSADALIAQLLKSLLSSFLGLNTDDRDAPDFEDDSVEGQGALSSQERSRLERDYSQNRESGERQRYGDYSKSVGVWNAESLEKSAAKLAELRQTAEKANGGKPLEYTSPVDGGRINSKFGQREASATGGVGSTDHKGLDIGPPVRGEKVPVRAPMAGVVVGAGWRGGYGNMVEIVDIYGMHHRFGHLDSTSIKPGDIVTRGQQFAVMGTTGHSTGVHLHYEQRDGDGNARAPQIAGKIWDKGEVLPGAGTAKPVVAANTGAPAAKAAEPPHPAKLAARAAVRETLTTPVAKPADHPKGQPHESGLQHALSTVQSAGMQVLKTLRLA